MHVKYHIEEEMHHIHNLQSVVIDITDSHEHEHEHHHEHEHSEHVWELVCIWLIVIINKWLINEYCCFTLNASIHDQEDEEV